MIPFYTGIYAVGVSQMILIFFHESLLLEGSISRNTWHFLRDIDKKISLL